MARYHNNSLNLMKSAYALPAFSAAALHAIFLLGFENPPGIRLQPVPAVDEPEIPAMVIPLFPVEPPEPVDARTAATDRKEPVDVSDIAPQNDVADLPDHPSPEKLPAVQMERVVLNTDGFRQDPRHYRSGTGDYAGDAAQRFGNVFSSGALDRIPDARLRVPPRYPDAMRRVGLEASVVVTFVVGPDGKVLEAKADESAAREFAEAAEQAVRRWRFEPGTRLGKPVSFRMSVPLVFSITE